MWVRKFALIHHGFRQAPTPMAGLALAIASLGWCWDSAFDLHHFVKWGTALTAAALLAVLAYKFVFHYSALREELAHPVVGSVVPTFAMACMVVSNSVVEFSQLAGDAIWLAAIALHISFLLSFCYHRAKQFELAHMVPSWFVPPVGIIVADVAFTGNPALRPIADFTLYFGLLAYAIMLPMMVYRLIFSHEIPDAAKPTIAILAAPASLSLAGYLSVSTQPSLLLVALLFGIAVLMTLVIYFAFITLLKLPFSPAYAAFTFPMVIGATALFKLSSLLETLNFSGNGAEQVWWLAAIELTIATLVVGYVSVRYLQAYVFKARDK
ncbi:TDT family transporter [Vibrio hippocampi]|uniref:C4-dicarboxylate ABC transporter n=1 Tax=Vibrio hippocampi TaxID=654686 RepID=A0ABN8DID5_9VIBR|nr:TDT family transporter [Vibrio hippocampi]CAH0526743.1 hypothetical protein VHP8226_02115 [Vibrio hippocampi]